MQYLSRKVYALHPKYLKAKIINFFEKLSKSSILFDECDGCLEDENYVMRYLSGISAININKRTSFFLTNRPFLLTK